MKILRSIVRDPVRKIFATVFAFGIWIFVAVEGTYTNRREVRISYVGLPDSLTIIDAPRHVPVVFTGKGRSLLGIWLLPPSIVASINDARTGDLTITAGDLTIPGGLTDVNVQYDIRTINLVIDKKIERDVAVTIPIKGEPPDRYAIGQIALLDTVRAAGPLSFLRSISDIATESLDVKNRTRNFMARLKLVTPGGSVELNRDYVNAVVEIDTISRCILTNIPLKIIAKKQQVYTTASPYLDTLVIAGTLSRIEKVRKTDIEIVIKLADLKAGEYSLPAEIVAPDQVKPVYSSPRKFRIKVY